MAGEEEEPGDHWHENHCILAKEGQETNREAGDDLPIPGSRSLRPWGPGPYCRKNEEDEE